MRSGDKASKPERLNDVAESTSSAADAQQFALEMFVGGATAALGKSFFAPIDRIKVLRQVQNGHRRIAPDDRYKGVINGLSRLPREQGIRSLWRGNLANVLRYGPTFALGIAFDDRFKRLFLNGVNKEKEFWRFFLGSLAAGGAAGAASLSIVYPLDYARTRLAADVGQDATNREFKGIIDCVVKTARSDGLPGLYRGFLVSVQGIMIYRAAFFGLYDSANALVADDAGDVDFLTSWAIAQAVTIASGVTSYPWDTVRRRMMMESCEHHQPNSARFSALDCVRNIVRNEGFRALYRGANANIFRSGSGALLLALYSEIRKHEERVTYN